MRTFLPLPASFHGERGKAYPIPPPVSSVKCGFWEVCKRLAWTLALPIGRDKRDHLRHAQGAAGVDERRETRDANGDKQTLDDKVMRLRQCLIV